MVKFHVKAEDIPNLRIGTEQNDTGKSEYLFYGTFHKLGMSNSGTVGIYDASMSKTWIHYLIRKSEKGIRSMYNVITADQGRRHRGCPGCPDTHCVLFYHIVQYISLHKWTPTFREIPLRTPTTDKTWRRPC